jgi:hypothetical protein
MSQIAEDLIELMRLAQAGAGAFAEKRAREVAGDIIAPGCGSQLEGG